MSKRQTIRSFPLINSLINRISEVNEGRLHCLSVNLCGLIKSHSENEPKYIFIILQQKCTEPIKI